MPIYEFVCLKCESDFERLVSSTGATSRFACPSCGSRKVEKKLSLFGVGARPASDPSFPSGGFSGGGCCGGVCSCN